MRVFRSDQCKELGITLEEYDYTRNTHKSMLERCYRTKSKAFYKYGAKGVIICAAWRESFITFIRDMGVRPAGHTLDRIRGHLGYEKSNCRWATP